MSGSSFESDSFRYNADSNLYEYIARDVVNQIHSHGTRTTYNPFLASDDSDISPNDSASQGGGMHPGRPTVPHEIRVTENITHRFDVARSDPNWSETSDPEDLPRVIPDDNDSDHQESYNMDDTEEELSENLDRVINIATTDSDISSNSSRVFDINPLENLEIESMDLVRHVETMMDEMDPDFSRPVSQNSSVIFSDVHSINSEDQNLESIPSSIINLGHHDDDEVDLRQNFHHEEIEEISIGPQDEDDDSDGNPTWATEPEVIEIHSDSSELSSSIPMEHNLDWTIGHMNSENEEGDNSQQENESEISSFVGGEIYQDTTNWFEDSSDSSSIW